jgi:ubiquinone/menaquinone biosynthesis C-methylase UbiE
MKYSFTRTPDAPYQVYEDVISRLGGKMTKITSQMPFVDLVLEQARQGNIDVVKACGRHLHFGYWDNPANADGSVEDFVDAAEALSSLVCDFSEISNGLSILDCGCGFGGTIASLNERFSSEYLVGLNIDPRQLDRARTQVRSRSSNKIDFVEGNACQLPFGDNSFDVVLAIECIMHFPSRKQFFQEAFRVLKPGGSLAITDFFVSPLLSKLYESFLFRLSGRINNGFTVSGYKSLAKSTGFTLHRERNITRNITPSFKVFLNKVLSSNQAYCNRLRLMSYISYLGLLQYRVISFKANDFL